MKNIDLKRYLLEDFCDKRYMRCSLMNIYEKDREYYVNLVKKQLVCDEAIKFFEKNQRSIEKAQSIAIDAFRRMKYEEIIDRYEKNIDKAIKNKKTTNPKTTKKKCKNLYVYVYNDRIRTCKKVNCYGRLVKEKRMINDLKGKKHMILFDTCSVCGSLHVRYNTYINFPLEWKCMNIQDLNSIKDEIDNKKSIKKIHKDVCVENFEDLPRITLKELELAEKHLKSLQEKTDKQNILRQHNNSIGVKDFVVRRNTFKCLYHSHQLENIDASIGIISENGDVIETSINAGYCSECNVFFIMDSTYQDLKMKGIPICRITDEKIYLNRFDINGIQLAQESILMQYGYSVSKEVGLTAATRRKILSLLVDNNILTRSDIIGYLDFFINQRKYQSKLEKAIDKWEADKEFISEYKIGSYKQYEINGITRKY